MTAFLVCRHTTAAHPQHSFAEVERAVPCTKQRVWSKGFGRCGTAPWHAPVHVGVCWAGGGGAHALAFARLHAVCRGVVASVCGRVCVCVCVCAKPSVHLHAHYSGETQCFRVYYCSVILATVYDWVCCMKWLLCLISDSSSPNCRMYASSPMTTKTCQACFMREKGSLVRL